MERTVNYRRDGRRRRLSPFEKKKGPGIRIGASLLFAVAGVTLVYQSFSAPRLRDTIEPGPSAVAAFGRLNSPHAILIRLRDNAVLMEKNGEERIYPASMTKIMTAIVALDNLPDPQEKIRLPASIFRELHASNAAMAGFLPGEQVRAIDLLYGVMLPSGAECCIGLAGRIAGSERDFVRMMNRKAADLGMHATRFENSTGLHAEGHFTTVRDLAVLLAYALQSDTFRDIFTSSSHSTQPTNRRPGGITMYATMFETLKNPAVPGGEILGGKTGYTEEAGLCLASLARVDNREYILITAGAKGDHRSEQYNIADAVAVYGGLGKDKLLIRNN